MKRIRHPILRPIFLLLRMILLIYIGVVLYIVFFQRRSLYYPTRIAREQLEPLAVENGMTPWHNPDGALIGWRPRLHSLDSTNDVLLVLHGNAGFALHRLYLVKGFERPIDAHAFSVYLLEYPGFGPRKGSPSESSLYDAAQEAFELLRQEQPGQRIFVVGESIGSGLAARLAAEHASQVSGLFLITPFTSMTDVARHHYPMLPVGLLLRDRYETQSWLAQYHGPVAFLLAGKDSVVPPPLGQTLYETYDGPRRQWLQPDSGHNTLHYDLQAPWWDEVRTFLRENAPPAPRRL